MSLLHSVPAEPRPVRCASVPALPHPRLRRYVVGYAGFASGDGAAVRHRVLPFALTTLVIDVGGRARIVTGPRDTPAVHTRTAWATGVTVGLTPAGASALLGVPMAELAGATVPLADVLGGRDREIAERLHAAPDPAARFAVLDEMLTPRPVPARPADPVVGVAWAMLHRSAGRLRVGALADRLGVSRRYLELGFRRQIGLPPGAVGRIARFQRAVALLGRGAGPARTAAECGYADQPHLHRDVRRMAGLTPATLCALLQDPPATGALASRT
ncbi:helix-turn-helix transcriptional regulator [Jidongwangia harbinensis]|uniref:helix-turn-helix transcriptional regulator n=1 Tax=Jidongwangia harbinensis TaxID=2878561 RepID=UPI001CD9AF38|nr:AraC family transcriptional regulator [Jidongwangia harbinensis]MCA2219166.1 AraC family transcriptional regulator [Jidongwangia harbinensis]